MVTAARGAADADDDGELMSFETRTRRRLRGRARRKGAAVIRAADADEWRALLDSLGADEDGVITGEAVLAILSLPEDRELPDDPARKLARRLDRDRDGVLELVDLEEIFAHFDEDADSALSAEKMPRTRR